MMQTILCVMTSLDAHRLYDTLATLAGSKEPVIAAPPTLVLALLDWMDDHKAKPLDLSRSNGWVVTAGGWKRAAKSAIDRSEFGARVTRSIGVKQDHIRDVFNMVESNTIVFECELGAKHIPPWLSVTARSPRDLSIVGSGEQGILAYIDATPLKLSRVYSLRRYRDGVGHSLCLWSIGGSAPAPIVAWR